MTKMLVAMTLALGVLASPAFAGETTVTLAVRNWYCAACPHVVKESLAAVPGVTNVAVSDKTKTAVVTFDDTKADVKALINATTGLSLVPILGRDAVAMKDRALIATGAVGVVLAAIDPLSLVRTAARPKRNAAD
jgi:mercuric ion binding protein